MKGDLTLKILTTSDNTLVYTLLVKSTVCELVTSELENPGEPSSNDIFAALMRIAGNALDDAVERAREILASGTSRKRFETVVREAYTWKLEGMW